MQVESASRDAIELLQAPLGIAPEALNAINMMFATRELVFTMIDSEMLCITDINQTVIAAPAVRVDNRSQRDATANNGLQCGLLAVGHDFGINAAVAFEDAEDDGLARGSAASLATDSTSAEVAFVNLDFASRKGRGALTFLCDPLSDFEKDRSHAAARQPRQLSRMTSCQIEREMAHELAKFALANFRPLVIAV